LRKAVGRVLIAALLVGCAGLIVAYRLRPRRSETSVQTPEELPKDAQQSAEGYSFTRSEGPNLVFTVRAQRAVDFEGGKGTTLEGIEVEIFGRESKQHDLVTTNSCQYNSDSGDFFCAGLVKVELNAPQATTPARATSDHAPASSDAWERQPIFLETSQLSYSQKSAWATTSAPVKWRYGLASGSALGLTYATRDGRIELQNDVAVDWPVKGSIAPSVLKLTAAHLRYAKDQQSIEMTGPVRVTEGDRHLEAQHAILYLDARNRLTGALFDGGVNGTDPSGKSSLSAQAASLQAEFDPQTGEVRQLDAFGSVQLESRGPASGVTRLVADQVRVGFVGAHFHPDQGSATGNVRLTAQPSGAPHPVTAASEEGQSSLRSEELDANLIEFAFHPEDGTLDHANTVGTGKLILAPSSAKQGKRVVTAGQFLMVFDQLGRLTDLQGLAPTRIVFEPAPNAPAETAAVESLANNLRAKLNPNTEAIESLRQSGEYQLLDGDAQANANEADYSADASTVTLTGKPTLRNTDARMAADHVSVQLATNSAEGYGHVTSTHFGPLEKSPTRHSTNPPASATVPSAVSPVATGKRPTSEDKNSRTLQVGSGDDSSSSADITNVLADRVTADRTKQFVHYEGHVRAWRGADVVEAPSLDIYRADRRIVADYGVLTSNLAPGPLKTNAEQDSRPASSGIGASTGGAHDGKETPVATQPVTIRADRLEYLDIGRTAAYRGHVRMDHAGATLEAERLDAYFSKGTPGQPSELQRAVATGSVNIVEPGRRGAGDRAEYFAAEGKIELSGGPPTLYDTEKGFTTGRILTFFTGSDTLQVDGGKGSRALSKHRVSQ
jgi:lipopolysaccharide export system protein LptA